MQKKRNVFLTITMLVFPAIFSGCGKDTPQAGADMALGVLEGQISDYAALSDIRAITENAFAQAKAAKEQKSGENHMEEPFKVPQLPIKGRQLSDFIPNGWELMDSVELDFNEDKVTDYVGVLQVVWQENMEGDYWKYPRILFAVASDEASQYQLSFQDENLIRNSSEGGVLGDPYLPLTAENTSFTTHSYGGSAWRWAGDYTYAYKEGTWYLTKSEYSYGYLDYITSYEENDWETGIGIRKVRSDEFSDREQHWDEEPEYDIVYELSLDEMPTLYLAGKRWWLAPDRITDWTVESVVFAEDITITPSEKAELSKAMTESLERTYPRYNDEDCMLYVYSDKNSHKNYLVMYRWQDKVLSVLVESESVIDNLELYQEKIYYSTEVVENIKYKTIQNGAESIVQNEGTVGLILHRINTDGTGEENIFEYRYPKTEQEIVDSRPPYLTFINEISGGEIVVRVYIGNEPHPVYRMNTDGSGLRQIGQIPKK